MRFDWILAEVTVILLQIACRTKTSVTARRKIYLASNAVSHDLQSKEGYSPLRNVMHVVGSNGMGTRAALLTAVLRYAVSRVADCGESKDAMQHRQTLL